MTDAEMIPLLGMLRALPSKSAWEQGHRQIYAMIFAPISYDLGLAVVSEAILHEEWRPAPATLRRIMARMLSPIPDDNATYAEIVYKAGKHGSMGRQTGPNSWEEGPPPMSHPVVSLTVGYCGGWQSICSGEAQMQEGLRKQVRSAHGSAAVVWQERVLAQLSLTVCSRDPEMMDPADPTRFRSYLPFDLPAGYLPPSYEPDGCTILLPGIDTAADYAMPASVRLQLIEAGMTSVARRMPRADEVERLQREREAQRRQELREQYMQLETHGTIMASASVRLPLPVADEDVP
jgi:hypothetical protein